MGVTLGGGVWQCSPPKGFPGRTVAGAVGVSEEVYVRAWPGRLLRELAKLRVSSSHRTSLARHWE